MSRLPSFRLVLTLISVAANALAAGGIFTFPIMSPALARNMSLTQPQLTTIVLAAMIGQYPAAAGVGYVVDAYGPWACSLIASILFSTGFGFFSFQISKISSAEPITQSSVGFSFYFLVFLFFLCGLGTVNSYFSALFAATKLFPRHPGLAAGFSMGLFGLSPLVLSLIAGNVFNTKDDNLDVVAYTRFLAILTLVVHLIGALNLNIPPAKYTPYISADTETEEYAPLLPVRTDEPVDPKTPIRGVLSSASFWILALSVGMALGSSEMVISNIGTIVLSLPATITSSAQVLVAETSPVAVTAQQVRILSISNTISRIAAGLVADWMSPVGVVGTLRKRHVSRLTFMIGYSALLAVTFAWMVLRVRSRDMIWPLSIGVGISYGAIFTIVPNLIAAFWGLTNAGRNFGLLTYAPFVFTPTFSYLYAFLSEAHASETVSEGGSVVSVCYGVACWRTTFEISTLACAASVLGNVILWKWWRDKV